MADSAKAISNVASVGSLSSNDSLVVCTSNGSVRRVLSGNAFANTQVPLKVGKLQLANIGSTPANSTITVTQGEVWTDGTYLYVATANNTVKRVSLSAF